MKRIFCSSRSKAREKWICNTSATFRGYLYEANGKTGFQSYCSFLSVTISHTFNLCNNLIKGIKIVKIAGFANISTNSFDIISPLSFGCTFSSSIVHSSLCNLGLIHNIETPSTVNLALTFWVLLWRSSNLGWKCQLFKANWTCHIGSDILGLPFQRLMNV